MFSDPASFAKRVPPLYRVIVPEKVFRATIVGSASVDSGASVESPPSIPAGPAVIFLNFGRLLPPVRSQARPSVVMDSRRF
jgi:hypothetical protein